MVRATSLLILFLLITAACSAPQDVSPLPTMAMLPTASDTAVPNATIQPPTPMPANTLAPTATSTSLPTSTAVPTEPPTSLPTTVPTALPTSSWTPSPDSPGVSPARGDATVSVTSQQLVDLRGGPGFAYDPLMALSTGTPLFLVGRSWDNGWYQVRLMNGQEGWIYSLYLVIWIDTSRVVVTYEQPTPPPLVTVGSFALGGHVMDTTADAFSLAHRSDMTWVKVQHRFYVGQGAGEVSAQIASAHQNGFHILLSVVGDRAQMGDFQSYIHSYADFVAAAAALGADAIEVWNEPNIDREWPTGMISGAAYTQMLAAAYTEIKARAPDTLVISAAPAPTGFFGVEGCGSGGCNDDMFFQQMALAGAQNYMDCVGLHHNDGIVSPLQTSGDPRGDYPTNYLLGVISRVPPDFNGKPLCFTELGYLSPDGYGGLPGTFAWAQHTTANEQAEWLAEAIRVARSTGRVEMVIVWNVNFTQFTSSDPMAGYAILRPGGSCPACDALASAAG